MERTGCQLTIFFEDPFWVGIFERIENGKLSVTKMTFGAEPKDYEVYAFLLRHFYELRFSPAFETVVKDVKKNPKRLQREIKKQTREKGIGTKSQQALKLQYEQNKQAHKAKSREQKLEASKRLFALKQQKKKEKHRGR